VGYEWDMNGITVNYCWLIRVYWIIKGDTMGNYNQQGVLNDVATPQSQLGNPPKMEELPAKPCFIYHLVLTHIAMENHHF
jgi:hypothetical protein